MSALRLIVFTLLITLCGLAFSADGDVDPSFDAGGVFTNSMTSATVLAVDPNNRIVMAGSFQGINGNLRQNIVRFNANGTIDTSFSPSVDQNSGPNSNPVNAIAFQADGKILLGGRFETVNGILQRKLARLNADGSFDETFTPTINGNVFSIAVQTDGNILIGGDFDTINTQLRIRLARLSPTGVADATYSPNPNRPVFALELEADGSVLAGGGFSSFAGVERPGLARISSAGIVDTTTFLPNVSGFVRDIAIQINGTPECPSCTIVIAGQFTQVGGEDISRLARVRSTDGGPDTSFAPALDQEVRSVAVTSDNKIAIAGTFTQVNGVEQNRAAVLESTGALLSGFDLTPFVGPSGFITSTAVQAGNEVIFAGPDFINRRLEDLGGPDERKLIARFTPTGELDTQPLVSTSGSFATNFRAVTERPNGKIIVAGDFDAIGGVARQGIAQLNRDGSVDTRFNASVNGNVGTMVLQKDGKLIIGGGFNSVNGVAGTNIVRLNRDGSTDTSFTGDISFGGVNDVIIDANEKIVVAGAFTDVNGQNIERITRLETTGAIDPTFTTPAIDGTVFQVVEQGDLGYLIGGAFESVNFNTHQSIARLLPNGSEDITFIANTDSFINVVALQADGKILVGGRFNTVNMSPINNFARLLPETGNLDLSLNLELDESESINSLLVQPDGKLILGGFFQNLELNGESNLTRLLVSDADDMDFASELSAIISQLQLLRSGKLLVAGSFRSVGDIQGNGLAVIETGLPPFPTDDVCLPIRTTNSKTVVICL